MIKDGINLENKDIDSFLMMGQSNMAGRGEIDEVPPINNENCYMLRMGRWQKMSSPVNPDRAVSGIKFHSGISLAESFANRYEKEFKRKTGLIPCADGGTNLEQWMPGGLLYDHAVMQARLAMRTSDLKGILWHQGESDCRNVENIINYADNFSKMINSFRNDVGIHNLPVIIGEISYDITAEWGLNNNNIEFNKRLPDILSKLKNSIIVPSKGLTLKDDGIHFNSEACREFGERYFEKYCKLVKTLE